MKDLTQEDLVRLLNHKIFHQIGEAADEMNISCYVVGGYVRDLFLERPSNDIDVVVVGDALKLAKAFIQKTGKRIKPQVYATSGAVRKG